ncbi:MAG: DNA-directed RNA polymerase subunit beta [Mycoplasmataceae bacterium]|nr:DNA-directed RNA polymerase subunit beta [Mycoplasmataceae bacterium]
MNNNKQSFRETKYSNLAIRRDYSKIETNFEEPDLLEVQKNSYNQFLENEIRSLVEMYFPVRHAKSKYEVKYNGIKFLEPNDEEKARREGKTYERALYVDLFLINNETGEVRKARKTKAGVADGIFFANIPIMTKKGTFVVNGIEKFVISQIVRSPGAYALSKSQIKLNSKKKINEGYICEVLPSRGTQMHFIVDEKNNSIKVMMRNALGDAAPSFPATQLLKAFGMTQDEITNMFHQDDYIINTLYSEKIYNHQNILDDEYILSIRKTADDVAKGKTADRGSPIDTKLKKIVFEYVEERKIADALRAEYEAMFESISVEHSQLIEQAAHASHKEKEELDAKIKKLATPVEKILDKLTKQEQKIRLLIDTIITEKAAKDLIAELSISTKAAEANATGKNQICYQDVLARHFMDNRQYDLTAAGRYKMQRKLRVSERLYQRVLAEDIVTKGGKVLIKEGTLILKEELDKIKQALSKDEIELRELILKNVVEIEKNHSQVLESVLVYTDNETLQFPTPVIGTHGDITSNALTVADFISVISYTIGLVHGIGQYDDIDHLGNKRLRLIHEQLKNKLQAGMARVEKHIKEKLASISIPTANEEQQAKIAMKTTIKSVVNTKAFQLVVKNFFNSYQLTQFIDQQNPLSELTNKRRISAMGDGGISREDPNLDIRDVHYSHYGRICPIETPEGMNIGLIMSLAAFTRVDLKTGFLLTPYKRVKKGIIQDEVEWLTSLREDEYIICESTSKRDANNPNKLVGEDGRVVGRYRSTQEMFSVDKVDYIEISPRQVVSVAAGAIPFLENDDTTRALMGANMQRQAVPLLAPYAPIVGTGTEYKISHDSGMTITSDVAGEVEYTDGNKITIVDKDDKKHTYKLIKFRKSNQSTCINQTPIVEAGQKVKVGETLTDGPAMQNGELALGRNPLVAFTTWNGYNFEDAIIVSERLVHQDVYTSISIEEHTLECLRIDKVGDEEVTRDIPNVSEESKRFLDEDGVIMVGAEVREGDILVGKVTPKGQTDTTSVEKLLQAMSGGKIKNIRDASMKVPHGGEGIVAKVERFHSRDGYELDDDVIELIKVYIVQKRKIQIGDKMAGRHGNKGIVSIVVPVEDMPHLEDGTPIDICLNPLGVPSRMNIGQIMEIHLGLALREIAKKKLIEFALDKTSINEVVAQFGLVKPKAEVLMKTAKKYFKEAGIETVEQGKKKISDVDLQVILRNVGLTFEDLSIKATTPVFMGANLNDITDALKEGGIDPNKTHGKYRLIDGRSGDYFDGEITVGVMYMMKLDHMVDDKIHARSVGPYSKITQQPLGGKSQNGGQRFGEMEVWALEAYGAAYNLRELLTIKSDDVRGRNLTYSAIVKGKPFPLPSIPESFKLLTKQLQGLALGVLVKKEDGTDEDMNNYTSVITDDEMKESGMDTGETVTITTEENNSVDEDEQY